MAKKQKKQHQPNVITRPPIVAVMGHIDHGKSTLLDAIRDANTVAGEAGGITQHISAYVATHTVSDEDRTASLTFLDTPGHEAFQQMRNRGAEIADVAILVVSAEDGVKPQTLEALESIKSANIPYVVAINKVDLPSADVDRTKASLVEHEIYVEGMGGDIPWAAISAKNGEGINELLDVVVLAADLAELTGDTNAPAEGVVIESALDTKRGNSATLIITNGTLSSGDCVVAGDAYAPVRIMEDFTGTPIKEAGLSTPVAVVGFSTVPNVGERFYVVANKKAAIEAVESDSQTNTEATATERSASDAVSIPLLIKADVQGSIDAIEHELAKLTNDRVNVRVIETGVGDVTVADIQSVSATENAIVIGFGVGIERAATDAAERVGVTIKTFDIIYELAEWLESALKDRTPKREEKVETGSAKILKHFSVQKSTHVLGARITEGTIHADQEVTITRRDVSIGTGTITNLQHQKSNVAHISEGEFGLQLTTRADIAPGDVITAFNRVVT